MPRWTFHHAQLGQSVQMFTTSLLLHHTQSMHPVGTDQLLNVESTMSLNFPQPASTLVFGLEMSWKRNNDQPKINFSTTNQPSLKLKHQRRKTVDSWLILGLDVDFGWSLLHFQLISQPKINVDIWLRNWSVPIGYGLKLATLNFSLDNRHHGISFPKTGLCPLKFQINVQHLF